MADIVRGDPRGGRARRCARPAARLSPGPGQERNDSWATNPHARAPLSFNSAPPTSDSSVKESAMSVTSSSLSGSKYRRPPGPGKSLRSTLAFQRSPLTFLSRVIEEYGDIISLDLLGMPVVVLNHPTHIEHVLKRHQRNFDRNGPVFTMARSLFGDGLATSARTGWLQRRRLLQPAFHRQRIATFGELMINSIESTLDSWEAVRAHGGTVDIRAEMNQLTLRIVVRALFGMDPADAMVTRFIEAATTSTRELAAYMRFPLLPLSVPTPGHRRFHRSLRVLDEVAAEMIRRCRHDQDEGGSLLSMMMEARDADTGESMTDKQLRDEVFTMLFAGHETSANTLTWAWHLIGRHPEVGQRLREEAERVLGGRRPTMDDLPQLRYTRHVIEETLRLYSPAWQNYRQTVMDDEIDGYHIPSRTTVLWSYYFVHRHPDYWDDPERFDPDRFAERDSINGDHPGYFPFGAGPRICIGNTFAMAEMQFAIAMTLQRYRLVPVSQTAIEPEALLTLRTSWPVIVGLETNM
ncbi:cytochrome P450 [Nocardia gipuzkoensis]|uniref:cytochrome P450 n=1 Tax=Nocardia gipuzkoensis TaxID=2749991 RepID=UPI00237DFA92|nr:cytochrome P450 [Nocardia gipuzkoensis]MDE1675270.1 cytochrome P450 [Nocardia gipuzkoensis]